MKIILALIILSTLTGCGSSGGGSSEPESTSLLTEAPTLTTPSMMVIGDSLCWHGWPSLITGYEVTNTCFPGMGLVDGVYGIVYAGEPQYADITVIAIGTNDAGQGVDADSFEAAYRSLVNVSSNVVCMLPPLNDIPEAQEASVLMAEYYNRLITFCPSVIYYTPSDHEDGIHYTAEGDKANADIVMQYLNGTL